MRVAFLSYSFGEYCIRQANEMAKRADVMLAIPRAELDKAGVDVDERVDLLAFDCPRLRQPLRQIRCTQSLVSQISRYRPDVVHYSHCYPWFNLGLPLLRRFPLVVTIHDAQHHIGDAVSRKTPQSVMNFGYRRADRIIVHSEHNRQKIMSRLQIPADRIDHIPHVAIGERGASPSDIATHPTVLFFGRIWKYKGLEYLIRAQPRITRQVPQAKIVIAGEGEAFDRYTALMHDPSRFVVHNGWISDEQRTALFRQASLVALPYIEASQSGVVPVAYSFAKPVVVTSVGGLPEMVDHERTGLIVPPENTEALADAIVALLSNPARCRAMGRAGYDKLNTEYSPAVVASLNLETYERAIAQRQAGRRTAVKEAVAQQ